MISLPHGPLMIDIAGTTLTQLDRERLCHPLVGGIILFARNWANRAQLTALCADIKKLRADLLICVEDPPSAPGLAQRPMRGTTTAPPPAPPRFF